MAYASWLRSYFCARNVTIALVVCFVLAAIVRISVGVHGSGLVTVNGDASTTFSLGSTDIPLDLGMGIALIMGLVIATILAGPLARENAQHLEVVWTKPVSRTRYALEAILANLCAVWVLQILTAVAVLGAAALFVGPHVTVGPRTAQTIAVAFLGPIAWYAMYLAATSSLKRGLGAVQGLAWPAALLLPTFSVIGMFPGDPLPLRAIHYAASAINFINPIHYLDIVADKHALVAGAPSTEMRVVMLIVLAVAYGAAGILQWNRVEA